MNYRGYFCSTLGHDKYSVRIITDQHDQNYTEITLSDTPFILTYEDSDSPFYGIRTSTAQIGIVSGEYLLDIYGTHPTDTIVELWKEESTPALVWVGTLENFSNNISYERCIESFTINARDWLSTAKMMKYSTVGERKAVVSFEDIVKHFVEECGGNLYGYMVGQTKEINYVSGQTFNPSDLGDYMVSEQNFYTEDTDEPCTFFEVLEMMATYLNYTVLQYNGLLYFYDNSYLLDKRNAGFIFFQHVYYQGSWSYVSRYTELCRKDITSAADYHGEGHNISINPTYAKATITDSFYDVESLIPDMFAEDHLTNRVGEMWEAQELANVQKGTSGYNLSNIAYYLKASSPKYDDTTWDSYYRKVYDNDQYESVYYNWNLTEKDYTGYTELHKNVGATLVDFATVKDQRKLIEGGAANANWEVESEITFKKYLMIAQLEHPVPERQGYVDPTGMTPNEVYQKFKKVYKLKDGYVNPIVMGDDTYAVINCKALFERCWRERQSTGTTENQCDHFDYINDKWRNDKDTVASIGGDSSVRYQPKLIFTFGFKYDLASVYWNGTRWTTTPSSFIVKMSQDIDDDGAPSYNNWNKELSVLNNVDWKEWVGTSGYKIPLDGIDTNGEIIFYVNLPAKLQRWSGNTYNNSNGQNGYCWLSDLSIVGSCKGNNIAKDYDIIYESWSARTIDDTLIDEVPNVEFKMTTCPDIQRLSYSNIGVSGGGYLKNIKEFSLSEAHKPEENMLEKMVRQYSKQSLSEELTVGIDVKPMTQVRDFWWDEDNPKYFWTMGATYDYGRGCTTINILEMND